MAQSADSPHIEWAIADSETLKTEVIGNASNRFDTQRQSGTLGPYNPMADSGPTETEGEPGNAPSGT